MKNLSEFKRCCFTGYRPSKLPFNISNTDVNYLLFQKSIYNTLKSLIEDGCLFFYTGMAMGFDILAAEAVINLKHEFSDIKLICAIPFDGQSNTFTGEWKNRYDYILENADEQIVVSSEYHLGCYQKRNIYMVDNSDYIVTWYDGQLGGTRNTLKYAEKKRRYIINLNTNYLKEFNNSQIMIDF